VDLRKLSIVFSPFVLKAFQAEKGSGPSHPEINLADAARLAFIVVG
jgi:hypothetical protein